MFCIQGELLTGRFVATDYADRQEAEWPPHPARLFSALVAAYAAEPRDDERAALRWLEGLPPPAIYASAHSARDVLTVFVPVNDLTTGAAEKKAMGSTGWKVSETELATAEALLPEHRWKQPRTFPSVTPEVPRFALIWADVQAPDTLRAPLDRLAARVHRLGHSSSLVSLHLPASAPEPTWLPDGEGDLRLRVAQPGQLERLEASFAMHQETLPRVMPADFQRYRAAGQVQRSAPVARSYFNQDWIVLRRVEGVRLPLRATLAFATAVRGALIKHAPDPRAELLSGHTADGRRSARPHLAVVPLPFVGHEHADGELKGVALLLPREVDPEEARAVLRAVGGWEREHQRGDFAETEHPPLPVFMGKTGDLRLELADENLPKTLRPETWCRPSHTWVSVTPVALDHNPGQLRRGPDANPYQEAQRVAAVVARAERTVRRAVTHIGLPEPEEVELSPQSPIRGGQPCRSFPGFVSGGHPRVLVHARLRFADRVEGPVLIGAGRYYGYGLFRPVEEPS